MGASSITALKNINQGCVLRGSLQQEKPQQCRWFRDAVYDVEEAMQIKEEDSKLIKSWLKFTF
jgi:hypothetical protein